jgi:transglutaminase-like putative cysteine protease
MAANKSAGDEYDIVGDDPTPEEMQSISYWTRSRKLCFAAITAAIIGGTGYAINSELEEYQRSADYKAHVVNAVAKHKTTPIAQRRIDTCLLQGSDAEVFRESVVRFGIQGDRMNFTVANDVKSHTLPCMRPTDAGQSVDLESIVRINGVQHSDLYGFFSYETGIKLVPMLPDVVPNDFWIQSVSINSKKIPLLYLEYREKDSVFPYYYIDLAKLLRDDYLSSSDFSKDLELRVDSKVTLEKIPPLDPSKVAGMQGYSGLPNYMMKHVRATGEYPANHPKIQEIVAAYKGGDNVLEKIRYALKVTDDSITYQLPSLNMTPIDVLETGRGKCDNYVALMSTILRGFGIPSKMMTGATVDSTGARVTGYHAWAEVLVPFVDGTYRWIMVDPTWADGHRNPGRYINFVNSEYLYTVDFDVELSTGKNFAGYNVFQQHRWKSAAPERNICEGDEDGKRK